MSEAVPEQAGQPASAGFLSRKILGIPVVLWIILVAVIAYLWFKNQNSSSSSASSNNSQGTPQSQTGNVTLSPGTETIDVEGGTSTTTASNPQPTPAPKTTTKKTATTAKKPAAPATPKGGGSSAADTVTVVQWTAENTPWNSTLSGIAQHEHTSVAALLKLNPQIKNPNLIYPGEKIKVKS